ncbi:MAG: hypothetical protein ACOYL5_03260 [Phototrophicaceae bacterium]
MTDLAPRTPSYRLTWTDALLDLQDLLQDFPAPIYIVGGAVRDALMHRAIQDVDLATPGNPIALARKISNAFNSGALYIMDEERGVARAIVETMSGKLTVDVAAFRGEAGDILTDLRDRDYTINAMMVDLKGDLTQLIDPLNGELDLIQKTVRRCREGAIVSDPVRALRGFRVSQQLGFKIHPDTLQEIRQAAALLNTVSAERVRDELFKVLSLPRPAATLRAMTQIDLLAAALPVLRHATPASLTLALATMDKLAVLLSGIRPAGTDNLASDLTYGTALTQIVHLRAALATHISESWANDRSHTALLMLMALLSAVPHELDLADTLNDGLRLSNPEKKRIQAALTHRDAMLNLSDDSALSQHRFWFALEAAGVDVCLLTWAGYLAAEGVYVKQKVWVALITRGRLLLEAYYQHYNEIVNPPIWVSGNDLMEQLGLPAGKQVGRLLTAIREAQVMGQITDAESALAFAKAQLS